MRRRFTGMVIILIVLLSSTLARAHDVTQGDLRRIHEPWARATIGVAQTAAAYLTAAQTAPQKVFDVKIENRQVVAPKEPIRVTEGDVVELRWTSDEAVELHLHGYDIEIEVKPGEPASMIVEANASGRFPIESHRWGNGGQSEEALTFLEVYPK